MTRPAMPGMNSRRRVNSAVERQQIERVKSFNGKDYYDDRLFLLHLCLGTFEVEGDVVTTTIYHENPPPDATWCLVTYRNCDNYPAFNVLHFRTKDDAVIYMESVEPTTPLVSNGGQSSGLSRESYLKWKTDAGLQSYDYRRCYQPGGTNAREFIVQTREQFLASEQRTKQRLLELNN
jgi:hypothetical protein